MRLRRLLLGVATLGVTTLGLAGCTPYMPLPEDAQVTRIVVDKSQRSMVLLDGFRRVGRFPIHLGFAPKGHKQTEGDGKTPEGSYTIDRRNPQSAFHLSLGISYPSTEDTKEANRLGEDPGGDIFIHGLPKGYSVVEADWTNGCIAVSNEDIEALYKAVQDGTPITIRP
ncbi:MAG: L,D-transpeptidase family protein [Primorskyibacter sp.]